MILEGRTIETLEQLQDFAQDALRLCKCDPARVRFTWPVVLRLHQYCRGDKPSYELEGREIHRK